jgi:hypothetical protein
MYKFVWRLVGATQGTGLVIRFNGDTGNNYDWAMHYALISGSHTYETGTNLSYGYLARVGASYKVGEGLFAGTGNTVQASNYSCGNNPAGTSFGTNISSVYYDGSATLSSATFRASSGWLTGWVGLYELTM